MTITTSPSTLAEPSSITAGSWYVFIYSGPFSGASIQLTDSKGVPMTEKPFTSPGRRVVLVTDPDFTYETTGGTTPNVLMEISKYRR